MTDRVVIVRTLTYFGDRGRVLQCLVDSHVHGKFETQRMIITETLKSSERALLDDIRLNREEVKK